MREGNQWRLSKTITCEAPPQGLRGGSFEREKGVDDGKRPAEDASQFLVGMIEQKAKGDWLNNTYLHLNKQRRGER